MVAVIPFADPVYRRLLLVYRRLPRTPRRWIVRTVAPKYTVGAICLVERTDGSVLLVRQVYRDRWGIPGGLLKRGEDPADAVVREVHEEVGLAIELEGEPTLVVDPPPQRVDVVFRARPAVGADPSAAHARSAEIAEVGWFPRDELPELQHETTQALVALARAGRPTGTSQEPAPDRPDRDEP
jgi:ADP-ribose pyrophosphatase YjhB (NUDIX family)